MSIQHEIFELKDIIPWAKEWQNMPEYSHEDLSPRYQVKINFACAADVEDFGKLINQNIRTNIGKQLKSFWFPGQEIMTMKNKRYIERKE